MTGRKYFSRLGAFSGGAALIIASLILLFNAIKHGGIQ
jgi:hypothetical protein